jgi:hypothetical protein
MSKGIDTIFPQVFRPTHSIVPFEETILWGSEVTTQESQDYHFHHEHNRWLAKKYSFRLNTLSMWEGYGAMSICWHLRGGCFVHTNCMDPATSEYSEDPSNLYLVLAYKNKETWDGNPLLPRLKSFLRYLEEMKSCPIKNVYCRATDCRDKNQRHLLLTGMMLDNDASSERLSRCYRHYFKAIDWNHKDGDGKPYLKLNFCPKYPKS